MKKTFPVILALALSACACVPLAPSSGSAGIDLVPPVLLRASAEGPNRIVLEFDEPPVPGDGPVEIEPDLAIAGREARDKTILVFTESAQKIGAEYTLRLTVSDACGNSAWLAVRFYGYNPSPPRLLINEFITRGSSTHPDLVEIKVLEGGNMGGVAFYCGTPARWDKRFVFPPFTVCRGDFVLLHCKPQGLPEEIDETASPDASGGMDACPTAYDFWLPEGTGLSGNNGALSLCDRPEGKYLDAVLYSTRTSDADADYRGFGSYDVMEQADELAAAGAWMAAGEKIAPEDAVNPDASTTTRSLCRSSASADTDGKADFHIVPTRKSSFGRDNCDEIYTQ
ncbi:MAG: hypothetical protein JXD23_03855 [Spirochaetales bacterium]|nr:hypothetical protein [Spirochaetales bacterium]